MTLIAATSGGGSRPDEVREGELIRLLRRATVCHNGSKVNSREMSPRRWCIGLDCRQSASIYGNGGTQNRGGRLGSCLFPFSPSLNRTASVDNLGIFQPGPCFPKCGASE